MLIRRAQIIVSCIVLSSFMTSALAASTDRNLTEFWGQKLGQSIRDTMKLIEKDGYRVIADNKIATSTGTKDLPKDPKALEEAIKSELNQGQICVIQTEDYSGKPHKRFAIYSCLSHDKAVRSAVFSLLLENVDDKNMFEKPAVYQMQFTFNRTEPSVGKGIVGKFGPAQRLSAKKECTENIVKGLKLKPEQKNDCFVAFWGSGDTRVYASGLGTSLEDGQVWELAIWSDKKMEEVRALRANLNKDAAKKLGF